MPKSIQIHLYRVKANTYNCNKKIKEKEKEWICITVMKERRAGIFKIQDEEEALNANPLKSPHA